MDAPPGLALLLERGSARLVADGPVIGGARVDCEIAVRGAPRSVADCRERVAGLVGLQVAASWAALAGWVTLGWPKGQVMVDRAGWTLTGPDGLWWRVELAIAADGGCVRVRPRRSWLLGGPPGLTAERAWLALARRLVGCGVRVEAGALVVDVGWAVFGRWFVGCGWRAPTVADVAVRWTAAGVEVGCGVGWPEGQVGARARERGGWPEGQVRGGWPGGQVGGSAGQVDVLAEERELLMGTAEERRAGSERLRARAAEWPGLAGPLARARARALRFVDPAGCAAAVRDWIAAAPDEEAWWWLAVQSRGSADGLAAGLAGLADAATSEAVRAARVLALAQALERVAGRAREARTLLEPRLLGGETPAEVWRTVARLRAADPGARTDDVEAALLAALGEDGWRRRGEAGDLRGAIAEAVMRSGRTEASMAAVLRRILIGRRKRSKAAPEAEVVGMRRSAQIVADYYAQDGRWRELVALLERELGRMEAAPREEALRRISRIRRHYLQDAGEPA